MQIRFVTEEAARTAVDILDHHGFGAERSGAAVSSSCPTLWAVQVIDRLIGFGQVESVDVAPATAEESGDTSAAWASQAI
jgi:hypothetical protein